jgi:hypothetical protein
MLATAFGFAFLLFVFTLMFIDHVNAKKEKKSKT